MPPPHTVNMLDEICNFVPARDSEISDKALLFLLILYLSFYVLNFVQIFSKSSFNSFSFSFKSLFTKTTKSLFGNSKTFERKLPLIFRFILFLSTASLVSFFLIATPILENPRSLDLLSISIFLVENFLSGVEKISLKPSLEGMERLWPILDRKREPPLFPSVA